MRNITAEEVFSHMVPTILAEFVASLQDDTADNVCAELSAMAYAELVASVGQQDADAMLMEWQQPS